MKNLKKKKNHKNVLKVFSLNFLGVLTSHEKASSPPKAHEPERHSSSAHLTQTHVLRFLTYQRNSLNSEMPFIPREICLIFKNKLGPRKPHQKFGDMLDCDKI